MAEIWDDTFCYCSERSTSVSVATVVVCCLRWFSDADASVSWLSASVYWMWGHHEVRPTSTSVQDVQITRGDRRAMTVMTRASWHHNKPRLQCRRRHGSLHHYQYDVTDTRNIRLVSHPLPHKSISSSTRRPSSVVNDQITSRLLRGQCKSQTQRSRQTANNIHEIKMVHRNHTRRSLVLVFISRVFDNLAFVF